MTIWVDAQLSPRTARWIEANFPVAATRIADAIVLTKDSDFVRLLEQQGSPPRILWLTCGNTAEVALQQILLRHLTTALGMLAGCEDLVEIGSP